MEKKNSGTRTTIAPFILVGLLILSVQGFSQMSTKEVKAAVVDKDILRNWTVGESKDFNGHAITKVEGINGESFRTNIYYEAPDQVQQKLEASLNQSVLQASTEEKLKEILSEEAVGGRLHLYYDRLERAPANAKWFTVVVKDGNGNTLFSKALPNDAAKKYKYNIWLDYKVVSVPVTLPNDFTVEIIDEYADDRVVFNVQSTGDHLQSYNNFVSK